MQCSAERYDELGYYADLYCNMMYYDVVQSSAMFSYRANVSERVG